ncbi:ATP-binding response regulator [Ottowia thiooxydans]|uniref:histidine kinase n=1 Tax=Ottowia thiooxydans TaxID=219182 RepID=A0ABV2Q956_9BURK
MKTPRALRAALPSAQDLGKPAKPEQHPPGEGQRLFPDEDNSQKAYSAHNQAAVNERVLQAQVNALFAGYPGAFFISLLVSISYAVLYGWLVGDTRIWGWLALRAFSIPFYFALTTLPRTTPQECQRWLRVYLWAFLYHGFVWGLVPWLFLPPHDFPTSLLTALLLIMLCAGGLHNVVPSWPAVLAFVLPILLSLIAALLWQAQQASDFFLALCAGLYLVMALRTGRQHHLLLTDSLLARFENQALTEQLAEQVRVAQLASDEKTRFLAAASHDLRQPVHAIGLFGAVLEHDLRTHPLHANAERLMRALDALGHSLDSMLDVSHLDAGLIEPAMAATPLNPILQSLGQVFAGKAEERGLQLRVRATTLWVQTDSDLLQRMLSNLIENGLKYTSHGGVLVLARARRGQVWIEVVDTGIGIAPEHQEQVFAEFYQIGNPGRDRSHGLGMGLSIVRRLSRLLNHPVRLHSQPGRGSRFRIVLPATPAGTLGSRSPEQLPADDSPPTSVTGARVLLVEDEDDIGHAMAALLVTHGMTLTHATQASQAEELLAQAREAGQPFQAVVCDLRLAEGTDGLALALKLRAQGSEAVPTLLITGETAPEPLQRVNETGIPVLFKPVTASALLAALAGMIDH